MKLLKIFGVLGIVTFLAACSGTVKTLPENSSYKYGGETYTSLVINTTAAEISDNGDFNSKAFQQKLEQALMQNGLTGKENTGSIKVDLKKVNIRSQGAAIMLGFLAGADSLVGRVTLLDQNNQIVNSFDIDATYAAGGLIGGQNTTRMEWLYAKFAELMTQTIKG